MIQVGQYARSIGSLMSRGLGDVGFVVAVASGKGGVGKSTTAVNVAVAMANNLKLKVGLLDADVYSPSIHKLMNLHEKPEITEDERPFMVPLQKYGVACMSIGSLVAERTAMVWRGPMVAQALEKMIYGTQWGTLDVVIIDMPPGTGDALIYINQSVKLSGALVVTTPSNIALTDARRGVTMFQKVNVPVLGIIENMSHLLSTKCGNKHDLCGQDKTAQLASELDVDIVAKIPLDQQITITSDEGMPIVVEKADEQQAKTYVELAEKVYEKLLAQEKDVQKMDVKLQNQNPDDQNRKIENRENGEYQQTNNEIFETNKIENQSIDNNYQVTTHQ